MQSRHPLQDKLSERFIIGAQTSPLLKSILMRLECANTETHLYGIINDLALKCVDDEAMMQDILHKRNQFAPPAPIQVNFDSLPQDLKDKLRAK